MDGLSVKLSLSEAIMREFSAIGSQPSVQVFLKMDYTSLYHGI
jgi:hypothetical protein